MVSETWRMNFNETKCRVLKVTRNLKPVQSSYHLNNDNSANSTVICKRLVQKDLGVLITAVLKWNQQVSAVCAKANRMLEFVKCPPLRCMILVHVPYFINLLPAECVFNPRSREDSKTCNEIHPIAAV
jgi:hypothetical protein